MPLHALLMPNGTTRHVHLQGLKKQTLDTRDYKIQIHPSFFGSIAPITDLRSKQSPVKDQGNLGACTAFMHMAQVEFEEHVAGAKIAIKTGAAVQYYTMSTTAAGLITFTPVATPAPTPTPSPAPTPAPAPTKSLIPGSELFTYYNTRRIEGDTADDTGASIRDTIKSDVQYGCATETSWPYDTAKFAVQPPASVYSAATNHKVVSYQAINDGDIATMKAVLAAPTPHLPGLGIQCYDAILSQQVAATGMLCRPTAKEKLQGGHASALVGYDDTKKMPDGSVGAFILKNSWSPAWGLQGYCYISYNYISDPNLANDCWIIQTSVF